MKAIYLRDFGYRSRMSPFSWLIKASPEPQNYPREVTEAAIAKGAAIVAPSRQKQKPETP